jgi:twitching motility protein PilT
MTGATILLVSGDPDDATRARDGLTADGHRVALALDAVAAAESLAQSPADAAVLDLTLANGAGFDLLRLLRKERPELPVVALSAAVDPRDVVAALKAGAVDLVPKPLDVARLSTAVRAALLESEGKRELERLKEQASGDTRVDEILNELVMKGGSDLHLKVGRPPLFRVAGDLLPNESPPLSEQDMEGVLIQVLGRAGYALLQERYESDSSYLLPGIARFRVNAFKRMGQYGAAFRLIPLTVPTIEGMKLPAALKEITKSPQGMVLVTGPTGCGKSTTLAAMMHHLNQTQPLHVVTIEDPIEFVYEDERCVFNQRQLGNDVKSFHEALRRVLRQDPDVILMGEMRDRESMELAMHAAETGHLVFSTLHTNDAKQTIDRIIDSFPTDAHHQVRAQLALTLRAVVAQRLVRRADGNGRVAAVEIMINSPNIRELLQEGKTSSIEKAIGSSGDYYGMQTFNQALAALATAGTITQDEAMSASTTPGDLRLLLSGVRGGSAAATPGKPAGAPATDRMKINRGF